jgi:phage shock protein PspC (stress-responsive transcriptional regulator)
VLLAAPLRTVTLGLASAFNVDASLILKDGLFFSVGLFIFAFFLFVFYRVVIQAIQSQSRLR